MRLIESLLPVLLLFFAVQAFASYERFDTAKRPAVGSQQVIPEYQYVGSSSATPAATSTTAVLSATNNPSTSATLAVTAGITSPDVPRNVTVTTGGTTADCAAGNVTVAGLNILGKSITENLAISNAQNGTTTGAKAFKTVSSVTLPAEQSTHACTFAVGIGSKLGLNRCLDAAGDFGQATFGGVKETTAPTVANSATAVESNTASLNSSLDGAHTVRLLYYQNYRCLP